jgi:hypothetical protein
LVAARVATILFLILTTSFCPAVSTESAEEPHDAAELKTAFLCNFARFVEWPLSSYDSRGIHFHICVIGNDPFGRALDTILDKIIQGRIPVVRRVKEIRDLQKCHLLFIAASEQNRLPSILTSIEDSKVLTVSDMKDFAQQGGMVGMMMEEGRVRFEVNFDALTEAGLKISSQLLRLAKRVYAGRN